MKTSCLTIFAFAALLLFTAGCGTDANDPPDPRLTFEGRFELAEYQFRIVGSNITDDSTVIVIDTTLTVTEKPHLFLDRIEGSSQSMTLDPLEFVEVTLFTMWSTFNSRVRTIDPEFSRLPIVVVAGSAFEVDDTRFRTHVTTIDQTVTVVWERFSGRGTLQGDVLDFEFSMFRDLGSETIEVEGIASGVQEDL